jgi:hypothetical protein
MHVPSLLSSAVFSLAFIASVAHSGVNAEVEAKDVIPDPSGYEFAFVVPGWLAGVEGTVGVKGIEAGVDAGIDDILKNLDMIATGGFEVRKGKTGFAFSGLYVDASVGGFTPGPLLSNVAVRIEQVLLEATFTYRIYESERAWIELLSGARYSYMGTELSLSIDQVSASLSWVDPFVGFQGRYEINDKLFVVGRGDIGSFGVGSELTWNLYGAVGTSLSDTTTMEIGYRYLYTDYVTGGFEYDAAMKGVFIGTRIVF